MTYREIGKCPECEAPIFNANPQGPQWPYISSNYRTCQHPTPPERHQVGTTMVDGKEVPLLAVDYKADWLHLLLEATFPFKDEAWRKQQGDLRE